MTKRQREKIAFGSIIVAAWGFSIGLGYITDDLRDAFITISSVTVGVAVFLFVIFKLQDWVEAGEDD